MFQDSDSEPSNIEQQFTFYSSTTNKQQKYHQINSIMDACRVLQYKIIQQKIQTKATDIVQRLLNNLPSSKSLIFTIQIKRNQAEIVKQFIQKLVSTFSTKSTNEKLEVRTIQLKQVKEIVLTIYLRLEECDPSITTIFIVSKITDLNQDNIYIFEKAMEKKIFYLIIPTFANLESYVPDQGFESGIQVLYHHLFTPKQLFVDYMFGCLCDSEIRGYLPKQVLTLITDYDYYPLSYKEGVRRLNYCINKFAIIVKHRPPFVEFKYITDIIEKSIKKIDCYNSYIKYKAKQKILTCILDQSEFYRIPQCLISKHLKFNPQETQDQLLQIIRLSIIEKLLKIQDQDVGIYVKQLQRQNLNFGQLKKNGKKYKKELLSTNRSKRLVLEDQLTCIIHSITRLIRKHANLAQWENINLDNRIRPEIPRLIIQSIPNLSQKHKNLTAILTSRYSLSLQQIISQCQISFSGGQLMYLLADFQLCGIIDRSRKSSKLSYLNHFFYKSNH